MWRAEVRFRNCILNTLLLMWRPDFPGHQHQMGQFVFEPDPQGRPDHWVVRSYAWATINHPPEPPHLHWCGHIRDVVAKVDGTWKIRSKAIMGWAGVVLSRFDQMLVFTLVSGLIAIGLRESAPRALTRRAVPAYK